MASREYTGRGPPRRRSARVARLVLPMLVLGSVIVLAVQAGRPGAAEIGRAAISEVSSSAGVPPAAVRITKIERIGAEFNAELDTPAGRYAVMGEDAPTWLPWVYRLRITLVICADL